MKEIKKLKDLTFPSLEEKTYKDSIKKLQKSIREISIHADENKIPIVIVMEGWDASGKGGAIRRMTAPLDPRFFDVHSIAAPTKEELNHNYLWRFWTKLPEKGKLAIFDRSWYGRVLVERIEGFAKEVEWRRAYQEIRDFETEISSYGGILCKFWIHITPEEQHTRFQERANDPLRKWKLTDEDWRNREKWDQYELAAEDMFFETSTSSAPWEIVPGNNKYFARVRVLEHLVDRYRSEQNI
jgi:polyphosphate kinase 2 (PPK2 family)